MVFIHTSDYVVYYSYIQKLKGIRIYTKAFSRKNYSAFATVGDFPKWRMSGFSIKLSKVTQTTLRTAASHRLELLRTSGSNQTISKLSIIYFLPFVTPLLYFDHYYSNVF